MLGYVPPEAIPKFKTAANQRPPKGIPGSSITDTPVVQKLTKNQKRTVKKNKSNEVNQVSDLVNKLDCLSLKTIAKNTALIEETPILSKLDESAKLKKTLLKKIRQIDDIITRTNDGKELNDDQRKKITSRGELQTQLDDLELKDAFIK
jgi:uncharacterized protein with WD repeat